MAKEKAVAKKAETGPAPRAGDIVHYRSAEDADRPAMVLECWLNNGVWHANLRVFTVQGDQTVQECGQGEGKGRWRVRA